MIGTILSVGLQRGLIPIPTTSTGLIKTGAVLIVAGVALKVLTDR